MPVYTRLLGAGNVGPDFDTPVYTAPATGVVVVRDVVLYHELSGTHQARIYGRGPGGVFQAIAAEGSMVAFRTYHFDLRQVLLPGWALWASGDDEFVRYSVSGYLLGT